MSESTENWNDVLKSRAEDMGYWDGYLGRPRRTIRDGFQDAYDSGYKSGWAYVNSLTA